MTSVTFNALNIRQRVNSLGMFDFPGTTWRRRAAANGFSNVYAKKIARLDGGQRYFYASRLAERAGGNWRNEAAIRADLWAERCRMQESESAGGTREEFPPGETAAFVFRHGDV